ncbi:unnamed protein product [Camellia sinensis]
MQRSARSLKSINQCSEATSHPTSQSIRDLSIGSILSAGDGGPFEKATSSDWIDMIDRFQNTALESRLGIPLLYSTDAVHGNNNVYGATVFPHNIGLGATRDAELVRRIGVAASLEVRAHSAQFTFAPCVAKFPLPGIKTRRRIFQIHKSRMTLADDVNLEEFVMTKDEFSGADIKAICTEAGLLALRERRMKKRKKMGVCEGKISRSKTKEETKMKSVTHSDFKKAKDKVMFKKKEGVPEGLYM